MRWFWTALAWLTWSDQPDELITELIKPPRIVHRNFDESLRERTAAKRQAADKIRARANHVESGSPVADVLRMVK